MFQFNLQDLGNAGINTLMGMGTVFLVLIFISILISFFKYIPMLFDKKAKTPVDVPVQSNVTVNEIEEDELIEDQELVAVITAAIYASLSNDSKDTLVVRSIKRANR